MKTKLLTLLVLLGLAACKPTETVPYAKLLSELTNTDSIARFDIPATQLISSFDRTGANEDYKQFQGKPKTDSASLPTSKDPASFPAFGSPAFWLKKRSAFTLMEKKIRASNFHGMICVPVFRLLTCCRFRPTSRTAGIRLCRFRFMNGCL